MPAPADDLHPTRAGGLLLLVPVLASLGYSEWSDEFVPGDRGRVVRRLFGLLLARLGVPPDDAAWQLAGAGVPDDPAARPQVPARRQADASRATAVVVEPAGDAGTPSMVPLAPPPDAAQLALDGRRAALGMRRPLPGTAPGDALADAHAAAWLALCRWRLRHDAGIGPATLVLRPARLAVTPTHVDVCTGLRDIDLRVRRAGLDIDPGWVPWLGRVVAFRYEARFDGAPGPPAVGEVA